MDYIKEMRRRAFLKEQARRAQPGSSAQGLAEHELRQLDDSLRSVLPETADLELRTLLLGGGGSDRHAEFRAIGSAARTSIGDKGSFGEIFLSTLATKVPLLRVARLVETTFGGDLAYSYVSALASAGDVVADGGTLTTGDPTFAGGTSKTFAYKRILKVSSETITDSFGDIEGDIARDLANVGFQREVVSGLMVSDFGDDLWGGDGTNAPQGLLAGPSTTTAASASTVVVDDIFNAMGNVAAQYWDTASVLSSAGAITQLRRQTLGTTAAGGQAVPVNAPIVNTLPWPTYADGGLVTPATTVKTLVCGSFEHAFLIRMTPVMVEVDKQVSLDTDMVSIRVKFRADSRRLNTSALRVLVMA